MIFNIKSFRDISRIDELHIENEKNKSNNLMLIRANCFINWKIANTK